MPHVHALHVRVSVHPVSTGFAVVPDGQAIPLVLYEHSWKPVGLTGAHTEPLEQPAPAAGSAQVSPV